MILLFILKFLLFNFIFAFGMMSINPSATTSCSNNAAKVFLGAILCLGMYYNSIRDYLTKKGKASFGQSYRDQTRCKQLLKMGFGKVISLNDGEFVKSVLDEHIRANFNKSKSLKKAFDDMYPQGIVFAVIVLDFFMSPV